MSWVLYAFAAIGVLSVAVAMLLVLAAVAYHWADKRRTRRAKDARIAQHIRDGAPVLLADDPALFERWAETQGLHLETPKGGRR